MDLAQKSVVECAVEVLAGRNGKVIDFGCGNGVLLRKIRELNSRIVPYGIEVDEKRLSNIVQVLPQFEENFVVGNMFNNEKIWQNGKYELAILMPGRLLEADPETVTKFKERLKIYCNNILIYAYGDWLEKYGDLKGLAEESGFNLIDRNNALVGIVTFNI